jgi:hypothetical protein
LTTAGKVPSFEQLTDPNQEFQEVGTDLTGDGKVNDADAEANASATSAKKPKSFGKGDFGYSFKDDAQSAVNFIHGRGFKPNDAPVTAAATPAVASPAPVIEKPGAFAGAQRRGGTSPSGQQGRISSGASPSAPPAVRNEAANVADKPWPGQGAQTPVPRPMLDQQTPSVTTAERARPAMGATPAGMELVGMKSGVPQYAPVGEVYGQSPRAADAAPAGGVGPVRPEVTTNDIRANYQNRMQTPAMKVGADNAMRSMGVNVPRVPVERPGQPVMRAPVAYQSPTEKGGAFSREAYARTAAAQQEGWDKKAIREGRASEATRQKWADYTAQRERDTKMFPGAVRKPLVAGITKPSFRFMPRR